MGLSGLVGSGAVKGLEEIITQQLMQAKFDEEQRQAQAQEAIQRQRVDQDAQRIAQEDAQHADVMGRYAKQDEQIAAAAKAAEDKAAYEQTARANMSELLGDPTQLAAFSMASGVNVPEGVRSLTTPKKVSLHTVKTIGPDGRPMTKGVTDEELAQGVPDYVAPKATGGESKQWLLRNGAPVHDSPRPGDTPYDRSRTGERPVLSSDANNIADIDNSIAMLDSLKEGIGKTGASSYLGAHTPGFITEATGIGSDAKSRQAMINGAKQIIGKALEGGVLRKEDEAKYDKILPTIYDPPDVAQSKIDGLRTTLEAKRATTLEALGAAGYGVDRLSSGRGSGNPKPVSSHGPAVGTERVINGTNAVWDGKGWVAK